MIYSITKTCWGYMIRKNDPDYKYGLYVCTVKRDGTYEFTTDYTYAKTFSLKTATKHLNILNSK